MKLKSLTHVFSVMLLAVTLAACGGGGGGDSSPPPTPPPPPPTNQAPTITAAAEVQLDEGGTYNGPNCTASDPEEGNITDRIVVGGDTVDTSTPGVYNVTCNVTDSGGLAAAEVIQRVVINAIVVANQPPTLTLNGQASVSLDVGNTFSDPGATASDPEEGDITSRIVVGGDTVDTGTAGVYVITYNVSDSQGLAATQVTRTVTVNAVVVVNQPPTLDLIGPAEASTPFGVNYDDPGATASDPEDGDITSSILVAGDSVDATVAGTYVITYNVTDSGGLPAPEVTRTVTVEPEVIGLRLDYIEWSPMVMRNAPTPDEVTVKMKRLGSTDIDRVFIRWADAFMTGSNTNATNVDLFDDGTNGDAVAGDGIYTRTFVPSWEMPSATPLMNGLANHQDVLFTILDANGNEIRFDENEDFIRRVEPMVLNNSVPDCVIEELAPDVFWCPGIVNVVLSEDESNSRQISDYFRAVLGPVFANLPEADFVKISSRRSVSRNNPFQATVRNEVNGISIPLFDNSATLGSNGTLQSISYTKVLGIATVHEFGHRWGYFLDGLPGVLDSELFIHFGRVSFIDPMSDLRGYLRRLSTSLFELTQPEGGYFNKQFGPIMKYLASSVVDTSVTSISVIDPATGSQYQLNEQVPVTDTIEYQFPADHIAAHGEAVNADGSPRQTEFSVLRVFVTIGEPATVTEMTYLSNQTAFIVSDRAPEGPFTTGLFPQPDNSSINWAFEGTPLVFRDAISTLDTAAMAKVQKTATKASKPAADRSDGFILITHEPVEEGGHHEYEKMIVK